MAGERDLDRRREDPDLGAAGVIDEDRLREPELGRNPLPLAVRHLGAVEEDAERVAAAVVGGDENPEDV